MPPNLTGYYRFVSQKNLEDYLQALSNSLPLPEPFRSPSPLSLPAPSPTEEGDVGVGHCRRAGVGGQHLTWALF